MNPVLRVLAVLFGLAAISVAANGTYDVLKSGNLDLPAALGISAMLCGGCAFVFLGLTGKG